jgi:hypothetical protein
MTKDSANPTTSTSLPKLLLPPEPTYQAYKNSVFGYSMAAAAILTGIALAGSVIPFFMNTTNPLLIWLGLLVLFSAILWAAIYGLDINNILTEQYWGNPKVEKPIDLLYATTVHHIQKYADIDTDKYLDQHADIIQTIMRVKGHVNIQEIAQDLRTYLHETDMQTTAALGAIIEELIHERRLDRTISDPPPRSSILEAAQARLDLNNTYPIAAVKSTFNIIGWINAFLVNSVGVAISALSIIAFVFDSLYKMGILQSAMIPMGIAIPVTVACFFAGATAAFMVTRVRTAKVGEDMAYRFFGWVDHLRHPKRQKQSDNRPWFSKAAAVKLAAITIALIVGLGFAGFNYYTGYYFGSMLVELCLGNPSSLLNPTAILDATFSHTVLGTCFGLLGFVLTIISTSSFFYQILHNFLQGDTKAETASVDWITWLKSFGPLLRRGVVMTFPIALIASLVFSLSIPVLSSLAVYSAIGFYLIVSNPHAAKEDFKSLPRLTVILVMSFAMAAMAAIGTAKVGSFWYNYLPAVLATTSMLNIYGMIVFAGAMIAFPAVFNSAISDVMSTEKPATACNLKPETPKHKMQEATWITHLFAQDGKSLTK